MYEMQFDRLPFIAIHCGSLMVLITNPNDAISRLAIMYGHVQAARDFKYGVEPTGSVICSSILIAKCASTCVLVGGPRGACSETACPQACVGFVTENPDGSPNYLALHVLPVTTLGWLTPLVPSPLKIGHLLVVELPMDAVHPSSLSTPSTMFTAAPAMPSVLVLSGLLGGFNTHAHMCITSSTSTTTFAPAHQSLPVLQPARPVTAFTGLPRPTTASVQEQRRVSIQRNLHGNRPSASASSSTTSSPSRRKSGPPRPFSNPAPALASLDDFGTSAAPTEATLTVGILPKVLDTSVHNNSLDPSPRYQWKGGADIEQVQRALKKANLTFTVEVSTTGPIFEAIDAGFRDHCQRHNLDFLDSPDSVSDSPNTKPWVLLGPKGRAESRTWVEDPKSLTQFTFTLRSLQQLPFSYTPNNLGEGPFVFIAVRFRNLYGPIDCLFDPPQRLPNHVLTHKWLGRRVLRPILASLAGDPNPTCLTTSLSQFQLLHRHSQDIPFITIEPRYTGTGACLSEAVGVTAAHLTAGVAAARPTSPDADVYMPTDSDDDEYTEFPGADTLVDEMLIDHLVPPKAAPAITLSTVAENCTTQAPSSVHSTSAVAGGGYSSYCLCLSNRLSYCSVCRRTSAHWPTEVPQYYPYAGDFDSRGFTPATIQNLLEESQNFIDSYDITSSPSLALGTFSTAQFSSPVHPSQCHLHLHSPNPRRPLGSTFSSSSSLNLAPAFDLPNTGVAPADPFVETPSSPISLPVFTPAPSLDGQGSSAFTAGPVLPPRGSMADILRRQTPGLGVTSGPGAAMGAAIYVGFPFHENSARRNFFVPNVLLPLSPSVTDLIRALRATHNAVAEILNEICASPDTAEFRIAWSTQMIEIHDVSYSASSSGYREVAGTLRDHLHRSPVLVGQANPNHTSRTTFEEWQVILGTPLFVLYVYPRLVPNALQNVATEPTNTQARFTMPAPSRTNTPAPPLLTIRTGLSKLLKKSTALDELFETDGFQLAALFTRKFGTAYLQIRQAIIIQDVLFCGEGLIPQLTIADVAAWAGIRPNTYSNNLTFAERARATLLLLWERKRLFSLTPQEDERSEDQREKDSKLETFLAVCLAKDLLPADWHSMHGSAENLTIGGATVREVSDRLGPYNHFIGDYYKKGRFTICFEKKVGEEEQEQA
ncbi:hypothetical protein C8F04DRAFT_1233822 [Mycena alexandri]|uniref:Uncharacterized protein n=1 Tax=Mycena alexandri TaxID=1745969 RepID=A0AAD6SW61_9AGAR|nr:hypothetical protein C8F04DRAFT_1233822 [Mycena alexandri]